MGSDFVNAMAVSSASVYVVGAFGNPVASFSTVILSNTNPSTLGFVASLIDPTLTATTTSRTLAPAQLYPNPARYTAILRLPVGTVPTPLVLINALGRPVRRYPAPAAAEAELDLRGLPAGLYLLCGAGAGQRLSVE
jgi:hypothetical protein